ncbi:MAG: DUF5700 domain-containing putative Zn-dependent protease [Acidobacteriota bacterium]
MDSKNTTGQFQGLVSASLPVLLLVWATLPTSIRAQDLQTPQAQLGWKVVVESELQLQALPTEAAPRLPGWKSHGSEPHAPDLTLPSLSESVLRERMKEDLTQALQVVNNYLPNPFDHDFQLWIFQGVPYAAKTLDPHLILSARLLQSENAERLPFVLAHEIHHLALIKTGLLGSNLSERARLLTGLLTEGIATWLSVESHLFPELEQLLQDPQQLEEAFDRVEQALGRAGSDSGSRGSDLYLQSKWGYYVGCRMIQQVEEHLGRKAWLDLLEIPPKEASQELIRLYLLTDPPPEYRF